MSKVRPWLGLYLWMNKERQEEIAAIWEAKDVELHLAERHALSNKGAKIVQLPKRNNLKAK